MGKERPADLAARLAMLLLRHSQRLEQGSLAGAVGITPTQASDFERGRRPIPREVLDAVAEATGFPGSLLDPLLAAIRSFLVAGKGRSRADRALAEVLSLELVGTVREAADLLLSTRGRARAGSRPRAEDRAEGEALRTCLRERCTPAGARLLVEEADDEYRSWVVAEQAALSSVARAPNHPAEALEWARLAVSIAAQVPGGDAWRSRLEGWALHFQANAERACNDLPAAEASLARGRRLWEAGAPGNPGLLSEAWLPWIEANLRRAQRRFAEALQKIDEALALDQGELRGQILLSKARLLETMGDPEASTAALLAAEPLIDAHREPRLAFGVRFNLLVDLCELGRAAEAQPRLPAVCALAERMGEPLDLARCAWLRGRIEAGSGNAAEAVLAFGDVRREFREHGLAYDYALVSLDLSLVLLELGRSAEVAAIAREMLWIFKAQGVHREALAALQVFCRAARREAATVELARRVERYLRRAQLDPELAFEE